MRRGLGWLVGVALALSACGIKAPPRPPVEGPGPTPEAPVPSTPGAPSSTPGP